MNSQPLDPDLAPSEPEQEDPRVLAALKEYQAALEAGRRPDRAEFLSRHPDLAGALAEALDAIEFVQAAANRLHPPPPVAPLSESLVGTTLGEYRIVRELGRGGMGVVYEAVQLSLGRHVALKLLPPQWAASPRHLERFRREARAAARLHHTNIVPVFGVGAHRGLYYYAMQYIQGQSLDSVLQQLRSQRAAHSTAPTTAPSLAPLTSQEGTEDRAQASGGCLTPRIPKPTGG
ncbi:MAG: protein kinase [Gemmataceae bacterium]|nr:protein kinase [Gemmataceae bacterium]